MVVVYSAEKDVMKWAWLAGGRKQKATWSD